VENDIKIDFKATGCDVTTGYIRLRLSKEDSSKRGNKNFGFPKRGEIQE
jgi:hypothetical protein